MKAFLLAAGRGVRFRPVTERIPKPLFPFLNVPIAAAHLARLREAGVREAAVNLHHLGEQIERHLRDRAADLPQLTFFREPEILGTAGALANARDFLGADDFLLVNADAAITPDFPRLFARHRESGRAVTLLVVENREPDRYTPLEPEGDRIASFGGVGDRPLLYTGVAALSPRLLAQIAAGRRSLVEDLWKPLLEEGREQIGWALHDGPFADLGRPSDFLRATLEALDRGGPFPRFSGDFDAHARVLSLIAPGPFDALRSALGRARVGPGARIQESAVWDGVEIGPRARLTRCLAAGGRVAPGAVFREALLWPGPDGNVAAQALS